uniref:ATP synthase F0 subunit 8 n=1 Tax=Nacella clypeater TaxID=768623 RepID=A0A3Q8A8S1_9GAST|nr:ATP synthase F0 subunit 8 [Nacella clypeater]
MPQLGPVNWLFVYLCFWFVIFLISVVFWWVSSNHFHLSDSASKSSSLDETGSKAVSFFWKW